MPLEVFGMKTIKGVFSLYEGLKELGYFQFHHNAPKYGLSFSSSVGKKQTT